MAANLVYHAPQTLFAASEQQSPVLRVKKRRTKRGSRGAKRSQKKLQQQQKIWNEAKGKKSQVVQSDQRVVQHVAEDAGFQRNEEDDTQALRKLALLSMKQKQV